MKKGTELKILIYCSGTTWSARERLALRFFKAAIDSNTNCYLLCTENGPLSLKAIRMFGLDRVFTLNAFRSNLFNLQFISKKAMGIIKDFDINIVQCFTVEDSLSWAFSLRNMNHIGLALYQNFEVIKSYRKLWFRPLVSRIDHIFMPSHELQENAWGQLRVPVRKCSNLFPVSTLKLLPQPSGNDLEKVGLYLSPTMNNLKKVEFLFKGIKTFNMTLKDWKRPVVQFVIFTDGDLSGTYFSDNLSKLIGYNEVSEFVKVVRFDGLNFENESLNLWLSPFVTEEVEDFSVAAFMSGVPVLAPRTAISMGFLSQWPGIGEVFRDNDIREFRHKLLKIKDNYELYVQNLTYYQAEVRSHFWETSILKNHWNFYRRIVDRRRRYAMMLE